MTAAVYFTRTPVGRARTAREMMYEILHQLDRLGRKMTDFSQSWWQTKLGRRVDEDGNPKPCAPSTVYRAINAMKAAGDIATDKESQRIPNGRRIHFQVLFVGATKDSAPAGPQKSTAKTAAGTPDAPPPRPPAVESPRSPEDEERLRELLKKDRWWRSSPLPVETEPARPKMDQAERDAIIAEALGDSAEEDRNQPQQE